MSSTWYVRYEHGGHYREVWCEADSKKEAIQLADEQDRFFQERHDTAKYRRVKVEQLLRPESVSAAPEVIEEPTVPVKRRWRLFRRR